MTERTIRSVAKELAGVFYEQAGGDMFGASPEDRERSKRFRQTYPTWEHYKKGYAVGPDGRIKPGPPGWTYFVTLARARLVQMLSEAKTTAPMKDAIYKALLEEHASSTSPRAQELLQRRLGNEKQIA